MRYEIYAKANKWNMAAEIAGALVEMFPDEAKFWIWLAYSTRRKTGGGIPDAKRILLVAEVKFPREYLFPYNLACYCSQLHQFREAKKWFKKAILIDDKTVQKLGVDDPDLKPLWNSMSGTIWKRE